VHYYFLGFCFLVVGCFSACLLAVFCLCWLSQAQLLWRLFLFFARFGGNKNFCHRKRRIGSDISTLVGVQILPAHCIESFLHDRFQGLLGLWKRNIGEKRNGKNRDDNCHREFPRAHSAPSFLSSQLFLLDSNPSKKGESEVLAVQTLTVVS
jgi:hypothetical protein